MKVNLFGFKGSDDKEDIVKAQVKTAKDTVSFTGGTRGGVDRTYKSGVKTYRQSTITSDVVIGLRQLDIDSFELYIVPTILVEVLGQGSISISKIIGLKNNYEMLEQCKNKDFVISKARDLKIIPP